MSLDVRKFTLDNGLTVLFYPRPNLSVFVGYILAKVGSFNESPGVSGVSHLLEHMMFKGTRLLGTLDYESEVPRLEQIDALAAARLQEQAKLRTCYGGGDPKRVEELTQQITALENDLKELAVPNELWGIYQRHGGTALNAATGRDSTCYHVTLPSNKLEMWAFMEADRLQNAVFREFYSERDVVSQERLQRVDNDPSGVLYEQFYLAFNSGNTYADPLVGWPSDLDTLTRDKVSLYFKEHYAPGNLVLSLVGDLEFDTVREVITRYFGAIPAQPAPPPRFLQSVKQYGAKRLEVHLDANPELVAGYPGPQPGHEDQFALIMAAGVLSEGRSSRFYRRLVESGLAFEAYAYLQRRAWDSAWCLSLTPQAPHTAQEVLQIALEEVDKLREQGASPEEIERVCNAVRMVEVSTLDSPEGLAAALAYAEAFKGGWEHFNESARLLEVSSADVQRVLEQYVQPHLMTVAELISSTEAEQPAPLAP